MVKSKTLDQKIDDLAAMTQRGFEEMDKRFDDMETSLERVEFYTSGNGRRIEVLEDRMRQVATKLGLQFK